MNTSVFGHLPHHQPAQSGARAKLESGVSHGGPGVSADERVRRTGGKAQPPRDQVPDNGSQNAGQE